METASADPELTCLTDGEERANPLIVLASPAQPDDFNRKGGAHRKNRLRSARYRFGDDLGALTRNGSVLEVDQAGVVGADLGRDAREGRRRDRGVDGERDQRVAALGVAG